MAPDTALRVAWRATWTSRILVWAAGLAGLWLLGWPHGWRGFDPGGVTTPFGDVGDLLVGPAARWDSVWYLEIAGSGYAPDPHRAAFFPLYPLLMRVLGAPAVLLGVRPAAADLVAGIAISVVAFVAALWIVHRLAALDLGARRAPLAVLLVALFPTALYFSAVYSESLFLALSAGCLYAGRCGRWRLAGVLGALASATRSTGVLLLVPLALLHAYGPCGDRVRRRRDLAWLALVPLGLVAYMAYLQLTIGEPLAPFAAGEHWYRQFAGPLGGIRDGALAAVAGLRQLASGSRNPVFFTAAAGDPYFVAVHNIGNFAFLCFGLVATLGALRRLPVAYGIWAACVLAVTVSYPVGPEPLASLPRYLAVVFPLHMWLASWSAERRVVRKVVLALSAAGLAFLSAAFTAWQWVA